MSIQVTCGCGREFRVDDEFAGRRGRCPACGQAVSVPAAGARADAGGLVEGEPAFQLARVCPGCGVRLPDGTVICTQCGFDIRTGRRATAEGAPSLYWSPADQARVNEDLRPLVRCFWRLKLAAVALAAVAAFVYSEGRLPAREEAPPRGRPEAKAPAWREACSSAIRARRRVAVLGLVAAAGMGALGVLASARYTPWLLRPLCYVALLWTAHSAFAGVLLVYDVIVASVDVPPAGASAVTALAAALVIAAVAMGKLAMSGLHEYANTSWAIAEARSVATGRKAFLQAKRRKP